MSTTKVIALVSWSRYILYKGIRTVRTCVTVTCAISYFVFFRETRQNWPNFIAVVHTGARGWTRIARAQLGIKNGRLWA